jgi:hypothetical protein
VAWVSQCKSGLAISVVPSLDSSTFQLMNLGKFSANLTFVCMANSSRRFIKGHAILIGLISMSFILSTFMTYYYRRENHRRDAVLRNKNMTIGDYSSDMKWEERERGDDATFFRYTV